MTERFAPLRLRTHLMLIMGAAIAMALTIAGAVVAISTYHYGHAALRNRLQTQADIAAVNCAAAVAFDDADAATRTLQGLGADPAVLSADVLRFDGSTLAGRRFHGSSADSGVVEVTANVLLPQVIGTLRLRATTAEVDAAIARQLEMLAAVLAAVQVVTLLASGWLREIISRPISALATAAAEVTRSRNFAVRVAAQGSKEMRELVAAFNAMLVEIDASAQKLRNHQSRLEEEVAARTAELEAALTVARQAARAKAEFLANMSHEIRTPMNGVIGMLDLLDGTGLGSDARGMVEIARNSADALLALINDILDFSKIDAGKLTLEKIDFEIRPLAEEVASLFTRQANLKDVEVICAVHNDVPRVLCGDPIRLRQIMANLMGNAVKFTERGEVLLGIRLRPPRPADAAADAAADAVAERVTVQIIVQDTGIGISEQARNDLFVAFTQADSSTTRKYGGTGLGLAITKGLIDAMGGSIKVTSAPGRGSTFSVFLPLAARAGAAATDPLRLADLKVLIIDDNDTNRCVLEHYLQSTATRYQSAASARAGLDAAQSAARDGKPFDVILLDYQMPEVDGLGFLRLLRGNGGVVGRTPCIVLSSLGSRVAEAKSLDVAAWLTKPVRKDALQNMLAQIAGPDRGAILEAPSQTASLAYRGARVLVVEDNRVNQEVAVRLLKTFGIAASIVDDGEKAVSAVRAENFDLVLMDCQMPVMDGYEAARAIRTWERESAGAVARRTPIVAMTANALAGDREKCLAAGMDDYVSKPVKRDTLARALSMWLEGAAPAPPAALNADSRLVGSAALASDLVDSGALAQLRELMGNDFADVIDTYLRDAAAQLLIIDAAVERGDPALVQRAAHSLKSSSEAVGALGVQSTAQALETRLRSGGEWEPPLRDIAALKAALEAVSPHLREISAAAAAAHPSDPIAGHGQS